MIKSFAKVLISSGKVRPFDINGDGQVDIHDIAAILTGERIQQVQNPNFLEQRVRNLWAKSEHEFTLLSVMIGKRENQARGLLTWVGWHGQDGKINKVLGKIMKQFEDQELSLYRVNFISNSDKIKEQISKISDVKASMSMRPDSDRAKYQRVLNKLEGHLADSRNKVDIAVASFQSRMKNYSVDFTKEQAIVLLARIDAEDITRMSSIFAVISSMTSQYSQTSQQRSESTEVAKKYYGIYIGLLELQLLVQSQYMRRIDTVYLKGLDEIITSAQKLSTETRLKSKSAPEDLVERYGNNLISQEFTVKVTEMYAQGNRVWDLT